MSKTTKQVSDWLGCPLSYDTLRSWVRCPYTLEKHEKEAYKSFIESHGIGLGDFGWFFEYHWSMGEIASTELKALLDFVDKLNDVGIMLFPDLSTEELKAILDDMDENMPDDVGLDVLYGKIYEEYHCRIKGKRLLSPRPIICYISNTVFDISYFLNELQNDSHYLYLKKRKRGK